MSLKDLPRQQIINTLIDLYGYSENDFIGVDLPTFVETIPQEHQAEMLAYNI